MNQKISAPSLVWTTGQDGRVNLINAGWLELTGKTLEKSVQDGWLDDVHPDDREYLNKIIQSGPGADREYPVFFRIRQAGGEYAKAEGMLYPNIHPDGQFFGWTGSAVTVDQDQAAQAVFSLVSKNMREIVCLISADTRIQYISPAVETILGYSQDEITGQLLSDIFESLGKNPEFQKYFSNAGGVENPEYYEICLPRKSGEMVWLEMDLQFLRDDAGTLQNVQVVARDVTIRKHNEEMLRLHNEVAAALWETADLKDSLEKVLKIVLTIEGIDSGGVYVANADTHHLDLITQTGLSPAFASAVSHYPPDHPLIRMAQSGQSLFANFPELAPQVEDKPLEGSEEENILGVAAIPILYKKKLIAIFTLASHSVIDIPIHSRKILQNLTPQIGALISRNQAETALRESESKFRSFFEQSTDIMSLVDEEGVIVEWNPASEGLTGLTKPEAVGRPSVDVQFDLLPPEKKSARMYRKMQERYTSVQNSGVSSFFNRILEGQILDKKGKRRFFQQVVFPIRTAKGIMLGSTGRDVTQLKLVQKAEQEQRKLTEALIVSASVLNNSLKLENIYQNIFTLAGNIVANDGGSLMMLDSVAGNVKIAWATGSEEHLLTSFAPPQEFPVSTFPVLVKMYETARPILVENIQESPLFQNHPGRGAMLSYLGVPICINRKVIGFLNLFCPKSGFFEEKHAEWLQAFANQAALAIENARLFARVEQLAVLDELTHVYNRRGLKEIGDREVERALRFGHELAALFLDVDHFKEINDLYSHAIGDQVLQAVASCFGEQLRSVDVIGRYGGEEFVFLLPETSLPNAGAIAERLRLEIEKMTVTTAQGDLKVTVSIGVSCLTDGIHTLEGLLDKADNAVHRAKAAGRNRVEMGNL